MTAGGSDGIAVVGASGFLGGSLCAALRTAGVPFAEFTRTTPCVTCDGQAHPGLARARTVFFLAGSMTPATAERGNGSLPDVELLKECLACLRRAETAPRVVLASSGGRVYDTERPPPYAESAPLRARGRYAHAKLELERRLLADDAAWRPVVLRISNAYGPGQRVRNEHGVVAHWLAAASRGEPITIFGSPTASRDYVYVDDVVAALRAVHEHPDPPRVLNVGSGRPTSLEELAAEVGRVVGGVEIRSEPARGFDPDRTWLDTTLAHEAIGWSARVSLEEGLRRTWVHRGWEDDAS